MRSYAVFSVAFIAAAVVPVMSVPIAGSQSAQPVPTALAPNQNQTAQVPPAPVNLVGEFLSSLSPGQLQDLTVIVQIALNSSDPTSPMPTNSSTPTQPEKRAGFGTLFSGIKKILRREVEPISVVKGDFTRDELERRQLWNPFGFLGKSAAKAGVKVGEKAAESAIKRAVEPTPIAKTDFTRPFFGLGPEVIKHLPELERRQLGDLFEILGKDAAKARAKVGEKIAESAIKRAVEPTPTAKADDMQDELERRQLWDLLGLLGKGAAKVGLKVGEQAAESAIKSSVKRTAAPIPNAKRDWTPPAIPTPPPVPSCWRTESCD